MIVSLLNVVVVSVSTVGERAGTAALPASLPDKLNVDVMLVTGRATLLLLQTTDVPGPVFGQVIPPGGEVPAVTASVTGPMPEPAVTVKVGDIAAGAPYVRNCTPSVLGGVRFAE